MPRRRRFLVKAVFGLLGGALIAGAALPTLAFAPAPHQGRPRGTRASSDSPTLRSLAFVGDSLFNPNYELDPRLPAAVAAAKPWYYRADQHAVPGDSTSGCLARYEAGVRNDDPPYDWMIVLCGINDINLGGASGADVWAAVEAFVVTHKNQGLKTLVLFIPPFGDSVSWTSDKEIRRLAFNEAAQEYCDDFPSLVFCLDLDPIMADPGDTDALLPAYAIEDGLHWSQAGSDVVAAAIAAAIPTQ